ncbi:hypothetical protein PQO03_08655 [Lentisphaera profundi]|uniref:Uncharacterized protein n=1 Tax=Lentisphaera profundi TaxID=1658616 RepID=A0ABY7VSN3_9BACT|nr:hypothetical protein [Lentisphaera profundi]WDE95784.1 hypothetical protein PQO03_08655 [Lentisphaera profundi]
MKVRRYQTNEAEAIWDVYFGSTHLYVAVSTTALDFFFLPMDSKLMVKPTISSVVRWLNNT